MFVGRSTHSVEQPNGDYSRRKEMEERRHMMHMKKLVTYDLSLTCVRVGCKVQDADDENNTDLTSTSRKYCKVCLQECSVHLWINL